MKREDITKLLPDISKDTLDAIMNLHGQDIEVAKKPFADYEDIKAQLGEANKTIEDFKGMDIDGIKKASEEWKQKAEQAEKDAAAKIADVEFDRLLDGAIAEAKGKNTKAIRGLLADKMDALKSSKNQSEDIKAALAAIKESDGYQFDDGKSGIQMNSGMHHSNPLGGDGLDKFISAATSAAGIPSENK